MTSLPAPPAFRIASFLPPTTMSSEPLLKPTPYGVETDKGFISTETWSGKFKRKFKENPLVPIGASLRFLIPLSP